VFKGVNNSYIKRVWMIFNCCLRFYTSSTFLHCTQYRKKSSKHKNQTTGH